MSPTVLARRRWLALRLAVIALTWSVGLMLAAVLVPAYNSDVVSPQDGTVTLTRAPLVQTHGPWMVALIVLPAVVAAVCLAAVARPAEEELEVVAGDASFLVRTRRPEVRRLRSCAWAGLVALWLESLLGILSVGAFMLPAAIALTAALGLTAPGGKTSHSSAATGLASVPTPPT